MVSIDLALEDPAADRRYQAATLIEVGPMCLELRQLLLFI